MFAFIVTSAIRTRFGVFDEQTRLGQTLETIQSIKRYAAGSRIILLECSAVPVGDQILNLLKSECDQILLFKEGSLETSIANRTNNHDVVKNLTEVRCFIRAMELIDINRLRNEGCQRIFKLSGRYQLTPEFSPHIYTQPYVKERICVKNRMTSQFAPEVTEGLQFQYMCRLWSFPVDMANEVHAAYKSIHEKMTEFLNRNCYMDIEHGLYQFLDKTMIHELPRLGVTGLLGPNGVQVLD